MKTFNIRLTITSDQERQIHAMRERWEALSDTPLYSSDEEFLSKMLQASNNDSTMLDELLGYVQYLIQWDNIRRHVMEQARSRERQQAAEDTQKFKELSHTDVVLTGLTMSPAPIMGDWINGEVFGYQFQAKVSTTPTKNGIEGGRVYKLFIWTAEAGGKNFFVEYDRGWGKEPASFMQEQILNAIVGRLEQIPIVGRLE